MKQDFQLYEFSSSEPEKVMPSLHVVKSWTTSNKTLREQLEIRRVSPIMVKRTHTLWNRRVRLEVNLMCFLCSKSVIGSLNRRWQVLRERYKWSFVCSTSIEPSSSYQFALIAQWHCPRTTSCRCDTNWSDCGRSPGWRDFTPTDWPL